MISLPRIRPILFLLLLAGAGVPPLSAQQSRAVEVQGRVLDARSSEPVPGATVVALDSYGDRIARRVTDESGSFAFEVRRRNVLRLRAGGFGYETVTTPDLHLDENDFFLLELFLDVDAVPLAPLEVVARSARRIERSPLFENFDHRVERGFGSYFTRDDIERIEPHRVTDLLTRIPGVHLSGSGVGHRRILSIGRHQMGTGGGACQVQIYMDGNLVTRRGTGDVSVDELVTPQSLEGVEIYRGLSTVPPEFLNPNSDCGVVALWTRRGGENP